MIMSEIVYRLYGLCHKTAKSLLGKQHFSSAFRLRLGINCGVSTETAPLFWHSFIDGSSIESSDFIGLHFAGFVADSFEWCLSSWIWTNAACVRMYCSIGETEKAKSLCDRLISFQKDCGGWVVRNDYDSKGAIPVLAPNDSAYIANTCVTGYGEGLIYLCMKQHEMNIILMLQLNVQTGLLRQLALMDFCIQDSTCVMENGKRTT